jgi:predicted MarR family transcription regulator
MRAALDDFSGSCVDCMHAAMSHEVCPLQALLRKETQHRRLVEICVLLARSTSPNQTYFKIESITLAKHLFELHRFMSLQHSMWKYCKVYRSSP